MNITSQKVLRACRERECLFNFLFRQAFLFVFLYGFLTPGVFAAQGDIVRIEADRMEYLEHSGVVEAWGNVRVRRGGVSLDAGYVRFSLYSGDALAEENVWFSDVSGEIIASRLEYNFFTREPAAIEAETFFDPWFVKSEKFGRVSEGRYLSQKAVCTTCDRDNPHYKFTARRIDIEPGVAMKAYNVFFFLGKVPVFYLPYYRRSLSDHPSGFVMQPGYSSVRGMFALSYYNWYFNDGLRGRWYLDYFRNLGWGKGFDVRFLHGDERPGSGYLYLYHIDEKNSPAEGAEPAERWKMHLRHSQQISDYTRSILRVDRLSDPDFTRDYLPDETLRFLRRSDLERHRPEGSFSLTTRRPGYSTNIYMRRRVNDFTTVVENFPRVSFDFSEKSIGESFFYYNLYADAAHLNLSPSDEKQSLLQARLRPRISHQSRLWRLRLNPSLQAEGFWYDQNMLGEDNIFQGSYEFNLPVNLASGIWRIYDTPAWSEISKTRHLIMPKITYSYRPEPSDSREEIYSFADRIGVERESVRVELRNIIEGKRHDNSKFKFVDFDVYSNYNRLGEDRRWSNIAADLRAYSTRDVSFRTRASYNPYIERIETLDADVYLKRLGWNFETGFRIYEPRGEKHTFDVLGRARGNLGPKWGIDLQAGYDLNENEFKAARVGILRDLHCWEMQVFWQREGEDTRIMLAFRIKGMPGVSLQSPY